MRVGFIDEMDSSSDLNGIDVPKSLLPSKKEEPIMDNDTLIAVDLAKSVFEIAVSERPGKVTQRCRLPRSRFVSFISNRAPATVLLEACGSAHHWGRQIAALGHRTWALHLERTAGHNKAAVSLANKMARIIWATWKRQRGFESVAQAA